MECKHELGHSPTDAARSDVAQAQFILRALSTLRVKEWRDLIAIEMDIAQGSVRKVLKLLGGGKSERPQRASHTHHAILRANGCWIAAMASALCMLVASGIGT